MVTDSWSPQRGKAVVIVESQWGWGSGHGHYCSVEEYWNIPKEEGKYVLIGVCLEASRMADERH